MATGWHQLLRGADSNELSHEEAQDDEEDESEIGDGSGGEQSDDSYDDDEEEKEHGPSRESGTTMLSMPSSRADHHIDIPSEGEDSFWDDPSGGPPRALGRNFPQHDEDRSLIDMLAAELNEQVIPSYLEQFEVVIPDAELVVGAVPLEEVQQRERAIEEAHIRRKQLEVEQFRQREMRLAQQELLAREELKLEAERKHRRLLLEKRQFAETMQLRTRRLGYVFQQAESHLKSVLRTQQARVSEVFGRLEHSELPAERRRYRVEWNQIPVTVKIRAKMLRALKDKLPRGQYALLATLYDRLGGHALHWTAWDPEEPLHSSSSSRPRRRRRSAHDGDSLVAQRLDRPNVTQPFRHRGRFFSTDVVVNQDLYVVCPPQSQLRPGNVLVFELFLLESSTVRSKSHHIHDQIVAWGAMPLMTPEFSYVDGKFKIPFLKGEMDATMDKYRDIEDMYTRDLSAWLCNVYLHVAPIKDDVARLILGRVEGEVDRFDVEIDQRNALYRQAAASTEDRTDSNHDNLRIRKKNGVVSPEFSIDDAKRQPPESTSGGSTTCVIENGDSEAGKARKARGRGWGFWTARSKRQSKANRVYAGSLVLPQLDEDDPIMPDEKPVESMDQQVLLPPSSCSPKLDSPAAPSSSQLRQRRPIAAIPAEIRHDNGNDDDDDDDDETTGVLDTENYRFSVNSSFARESAHHVRFQASRKLLYLRHELFVDLGLTRHDMRKMEFWLLLLLLSLALWLRMYVHYVAQWLFLKAQHVAVFYFRPQWTTCMIKYTWRSVATHIEIGVIVAGVLGNWAFFALLAATAAASQSVVGELPAFGSKFLVCVGVATLLDPFLVFVVDLLNHQHDCGSRSDCLASLTAQACRCVDGDAFKLYTRFLVQEGSGLVGVAITAVVYAALTSLSLVAFYMYLLHVHMNGRMLDVYRRIHAQELELFLPHDCEVPLQELQAICEEATRWKGPRGTQRKVFVHDYVLEDPLDASFQEKSTHIAIYTIGLEGDGSRELHRHFLKSPDGAIVELFGEVGTNRDSAWQRDAAPGGVSNLAMLHNILQDHRRTPLSQDESAVATLVNGRQLTST